MGHLLTFINLTVTHNTFKTIQEKDKVKRTRYVHLPRGLVRDIFLIVGVKIANNNNKNNNNTNNNNNNIFFN